MARKLTLANEKSKTINDLKSRTFRLLNEAGKRRAHLIRACDRLDCYRPRGMTQKNLDNLSREIRVLPLRLWAGSISKWLEVKSKLRSGIDGWIDLIRQIITLIFLFFIPFLVLRLLAWTSTQLDRTRRNLLSKSMLDYRSRTQFAIWISRLNPFVPSLGMIFGIYFARSLIETTDLKELSFFLFYLQLYYVYRAFKLALKIMLEVVFSTGSVDKIKNQKLRIAQTANRISRLVFIEYAFLFLIRDMVRRALFYNLVSDFIFWINIAFTIYECRRWRDEIFSAFSHRFPKLTAKIDPFYKSTFGVLLLPFFFAAVLVHDLIKAIASYLIQLDLVKKLLSEVLRRKLERAESEKPETRKPPQEYLDYFDYYLPAANTIYVDKDSSVISDVIQSIHSWSEGSKKEDLVIIVGKQGMGKSTTITEIFNRAEKEKCQKILVALNHKILTVDGLYRWLSGLVQSEIKSVSDFKAFDDSLDAKILLCIEDIQNLFLGSIDGFSAYEEFIELLSMKTDNIFWCLTVNSRSWSYLKGVFGPEHFYGRIVELSPWRDSEIQKLILQRHRSTDFRLTFDDSIKAYGASDSVGQQSEAQFFRLLWGQSRGNPRSALMYWVSAISNPYSNTIHVGIPSFMSSSLVSSMSDESLFLLAAISKHECLTETELQQTTTIRSSVIRKCMKEALDKKLVWSDEKGKVRITSRAQYVVDYYLTGKNFLYE